MASSTGLLVLSNIKQFGKTLHAVEKYVSSLYIHINIPPAKTAQQPAPSWGNLISQLYVDSNRQRSHNVDLKILVGPLKGNEIASLRLKPVDMIFSDMHYPELCETLRMSFKIPSETIFLEQEICNDTYDFQDKSNAHKVYETVVLGGTFDRIHLGHKIFLTQAVLRSCRRLVVGVTTSKIIKSKTLWELILPVEQRISEVREFLIEIDPSIQYEVVPIDDPFGPTQTDPDMNLIVVSAETLRGGEKVNELRVKKNLRPLEIFCIDLVESSDMNGPKESKVSSSNTRIDLLGTRIRKPEPRPHLPTEPYIIGLTGGIASGKSIMSGYFRNMGAFVLDCDKVAHEIYEPGTPTFNKIVQHFGKSIVDANGRIDRGILGSIVFSEPGQLEKLNNIVWPELILEVKRRIQALHDANKAKVVVIEAAVLLRAGWESECHEVWSMIVPPEEAVRRVMQRTGLSEEDARKRIANQMDNSEVVAKSNVVFSSQWDETFTQRQAEKAWHMLMRELDSKHGSSRL